MSYEHCDTHDCDATNGCPQCGRYVNEYLALQHDPDHGLFAPPVLKSVGFRWDCGNESIPCGPPPAGSVR